jgi:SAM-dependent methyltransferase
MAEAMREVAKITHIVQYHDLQIDDTAVDLIRIQQEINDTLKCYQNRLTQLKQDILIHIEQQEAQYFANSTARYQQGMWYDTPAQILQKTPIIDAESQDRLYTRLRQHTDWRTPGMVIRPAHTNELKDLVALDPLYLVDTNTDLFAPVKKLFTPEYQRRLRYYTIEEFEPFFDNFPNEQFGFVYAVNYFNFKPLEIIKQYLSEIFLLLRPGGHFLFTFNDCDYQSAVSLAENHTYCYTPGRLIRKHIRELGYEVSYDYHHNEISWLEIKKPGVRDSIRGGQPLAGIFAKPVDKPLKEIYNEMTLDKLIRLAGLLNVDISQAKTKREFNIKKVRNTISEHIESSNYSEDLLRELFKPKEK